VRVGLVHLGRMAYAAAYRAQVEHVEEVLEARAAGAPESGRLLIVEHDPVVTISRRAGAAAHLLASPQRLAAEGVELAETDRGGDITYHGPGQLVVYPILDLNYLNLGLHAYMRLLEEAVMRACGDFGIPAGRDACATGVWVGAPAPSRGGAAGPSPSCGSGAGAARKICAMGVRVRKWVSMHGLALNVRTNLDHFGLIVPCGLAGRGVTSLERECAARGLVAPDLDAAAGAVTGHLFELIETARMAAAGARERVSATVS
jgi:lipoyl(octanoyl) transferase